MSAPILPGKTLGIVGGGQLGRMLAQVAKRMGYRVTVLSPEGSSPAAQVADEVVVAALDDKKAAERFADRVDVATFELEQVPIETARTIAGRVPVFPDPELIATAQSRVHEKTVVFRAGFPTTPFHPVRSAGEILAAVSSVGLPAVLKTSQGGYDGKGQRKVKTKAELEAAYAELGGVDCVLEAFVKFRRELSVVVGRGRDGAVCDWGVFENEHVDHVLDVTVSPARIPAEVEAKALEIARGLAEKLDLVGVLCIELFECENGDLLFNEMAPRPHNSGHLSIEGFVTSQFEQQLRTVCGLPLGSVERTQPAAAMVNLLGDLWTYDQAGALMGEPAWKNVLARKGAYLHLYGKKTPRFGRKMGHITALGDTPAKAEAAVLAARSALLPSA